MGHSITKALNEGRLTEALQLQEDYNKATRDEEEELNRQAFAAEFAMATGLTVPLATREKAYEAYLNKKQHPTEKETTTPITQTSSPLTNVKPAPQTEFSSKYNPDYTARDIKKHGSQDLKDATKNGYLPKNLNYKVEVRGQSIAVTIIGVEDKDVYQPLTEADKTIIGRTLGEEKPEARETRERVANIFNEYNANEGESNYTKFYVSTRYESPREKEVRLAKKRK